MIQFIKFAIVLSLAIFYQGCATAPQIEMPIQTFNLNGTTYVPLKSLCDNLHFNWQWDDAAQTAVLTRSGREVKLLVDSPIVLVNGCPERISPAPSNYQGIVVVPWKFKEQILSRLIMPEKAGTEICVLGYRLKRIVIDPGHGGKDPGAIGKAGLREKDVVLDIGRRLRDVLESDGFSVVMTRDSDEFIPLSGRSEIANKAKADLFISIHANANRSRWIRGMEVYHPREKSEEIIPGLAADHDSSYIFNQLNISRSSKNTKAIVLDMIYTQNQADAINLSKCITRSADKNLEVRERGVKAASFYVLRNTQIPAILIEVGYITNAREAKYLKSDSYRQDVVDAIAKGIANYKQQCLAGKVTR